MDDYDKRRKYESNMEKVRGTITSNLTVWCGICADFESLVSSTKKFAQEEAKIIGWNYTKKHGWVCLKCQKNQSVSKTDNNKKEKTK